MKKIAFSVLAAIAISGCASTSDQAQIKELTQRITDLETTQRLLASNVQMPHLISMPDSIAFSDGIALGDPKAPLALIEFTDLQCPYCAKFQTETFPEFKEKYIDTGAVYYVARELPLVSMHSQAAAAAAALRCTAEQDMNSYEPMKNTLFSIGSKLKNETYLQEAEKLNLNTEKFEACMTTGKYMKSINQSYKYASSLGLSGTPSFILGKNTGIEASDFKVMKGAITIDSLSEAIQEISNK